MGPMDALQCWMSLSLMLQHEHDITHSYVFKFPGPYEKPSVCINAKGLQILLYQMEEQCELVNKAYRKCVNARLQKEKSTCL